MATWTLTERKVPVFGLLDATTQKEYLRNGYIIPIQAEDTRDSDYNYHSPYQFARKRLDRYYFYDLFDAELCQKTDKGGYYIVTNDYGIIKVDVFPENYVLEIEEKYRLVIVMRLLNTGEQVSFIGDRKLISVSRRSK